MEPYCLLGDRELHWTVAKCTVGVVIITFEETGQRALFVQATSRKQTTPPISSRLPRVF